MSNAPVQFTILAEISGDIDTINTLLNTGAGMERWVPVCRSVKFVHPNDVLAVGSVRYVTLKSGFLAVERITFLESPLRLNYTLDTMGGLRVDRFLKNYEGVTVLEPIGDKRYRLSWTVHYECIGLVALIAPLARLGLRALIGNMVSSICREANGKRLT